MAKPREHNAVAMVGLILAAGFFISTVYLNYQHAPTRLIMADRPDAAQASSPADTIARAGADQIDG